MLYLRSTAITSIYIHEIKSLRSQFKSVDLPVSASTTTLQSGFRPQAYNKIMGKEDFIIHDIVRKYKGKSSTDAFIRAGPRSLLHFEPSKVRAAIVTCGGLCPGLNNVIRELVHALYYLYNVEAVIGIK